LRLAGILTFLLRDFLQAARMTSRDSWEDVLKSLTQKFGLWLALYGGWGLFSLTFLDSSVLSFPGITDLLLIHLAGRQPHRALIYAAQATLGSVLGAYLLYAIASRGGDYVLRKVSPEKMDRARHWLARNDFISILIASLLPPPAPLKVFLITAGVLRVNAARYGAALLVGRSLRYGAVAWLGARYGLQAETYLKRNLTWVSLVFVGVVVVVTLVTRHFRRGPSAGVPEPPPSSSNR
jgi:membrane protein YqaA with SNARE-associated domain